MAVALPHYAKIKDRYCIAYFGNSSEYLLELKALRPLIESQLPGLQVYLAYKEGCEYLLEHEPRILNREQLTAQIRDFGYVRELFCNMHDHPVQALMEESQLTCGPVETGTAPDTNECLIAPQGIHPTHSMSAEEINDWIHEAQRMGYNVLAEDETNQLTETTSWVIGVENDTLVKGALKGLKTTLLAKGLGTTLLAKMFPNITIISNCPS